MRQIAIAAAAVLACALHGSTLAADGLLPTARSVVLTPAQRATIASADRVVDIRVPIDGRDETLRLMPYSMRSDHFRVRVQNARGQLVDVTPPAPRTYVGSVLGSPDSMVRASAVDGGINAVITIGDTHWYMQPADRAGTHSVYTPADVPPTDAICGTPDGAIDDHGHGAEGGIAGINCSWLTQIGVDADFEFYQSNGSSVPSTVADIENILNGVAAIYNGECSLDFEITEIIVRTTNSDPYTTSGPSGLLDEFATEWSTNQAGIVHDVAHLFTGKNLSGGVIGIAYLSGACNGGSKYGLSQSKWTGVYALRVSVTAHEIGHNFSAPHCNGQPDCGIMCASVGQCAGPVNVFGPTSASFITGFAGTAGCLGPQGPSAVTVSNGTNCGSVKVAFTPAPNATSHTIWRATESSNPADAAPIVMNATSPYFDTNVVLGTDYGYWVTATNGDGCNSNFGPALMGVAPTIPPVPSSVSATDALLCASCLISWGTVNGASTYEIWRGTSADPAQAVFLATDGFSPYTDASGTPGVIYRYWVRTLNGCGEPSAFGAGDLGSRKGPPAAGAPSATDSQCPSVTVTWTNVSGASSYAIWRSPSSDSAQATQLQAGAVSPYVDNTAAPGVTYWYFVQTFNNCGGGALGAGDQGHLSSGVADINGDCAVNGADIALVLGNWNGSGIGDLNNDGTVDGADIAIVLGGWG